MSLAPRMIALLTIRWSINARYEDGGEEKDWSGKGQKGGEYLLVSQYCPS
jgi:hypothetical protein